MKKQVLVVLLLCAAVWAVPPSPPAPFDYRGPMPKEFASLYPTPAPGGLILQVQNGGSTVATWVSYGVINCGTNMTCTASGSKVTLSSSGGTASAGGSNTQLQFNSGGALGGMSGWTTNGTTSLVAGATSTFNLGSLAALSQLTFPTASSTGLLRVTTATGALASAELSGDATTSGSNAVSVVKVNGSAIPANAPFTTTNGSNQFAAGTTLGTSAGGLGGNFGSSTGTLNIVSGTVSATSFTEGWEAAGSSSSVPVPSPNALHVEQYCSGGFNSATGACNSGTLDAALTSACSSANNVSGELDARAFFGTNIWSGTTGPTSLYCGGTPGSRVSQRVWVSPQLNLYIDGPTLPFYTDSTASAFGASTWGTPAIIIPNATILWMTPLTNVALCGASGQPVAGCTHAFPQRALPITNIAVACGANSCTGTYTTSTQLLASGGPSVNVTSFTGTSGTLTFTNSGTNTFFTGFQTVLFGFTGGNAGLNGQTVTILAAGLTSTTFEATVTGSGYSSGAGSASQQNIYPFNNPQDGEPIFIRAETGACGSTCVPYSVAREVQTVPSSTTFTVTLPLGTSTTGCASGCGNAYLGTPVVGVGTGVANDPYIPQNSGSLVQGFTEQAFNTQLWYGNFNLENTPAAINANLVPHGAIAFQNVQGGENSFWLWGQCQAFEASCMQIGWGATDSGPYDGHYFFNTVGGNPTSVKSTAPIMNTGTNRGIHNYTTITTFAGWGTARIASGGTAVTILTGSGMTGGSWNGTTINLGGTNYTLGTPACTTVQACTITTTFVGSSCTTSCAFYQGASTAGVPANLPDGATYQDGGNSGTPYSWEIVGGHNEWSKNYIWVGANRPVQGGHIRGHWMQNSAHGGANGIYLDGAYAIKGLTIEDIAAQPGALSGATIQDNPNNYSCTDLVVPLYVIDINGKAIHPCGGGLNVYGDLTVGAGQNLCADSSGSGSAQVCNTSPALTLTTGSCITYTTTTANTGTALTLNANSLGAKSVAKYQGTTTLAANDILANKQIPMCYDGTNWEIQGQLGNAPSGSGTVSGQASGVIPLGTSATAISNQSHMDDGNTTASTITSTENVAAPSFIGTGSNGGYSATEGTCANAAPGAGKDVICPNSTSHAMTLSNNNGTAYPIATTATATPFPCADTSASATTYTCTTGLSLAAYANGQCFRFYAVNQNNSGASTLNVDGIAAKSLVKWQGTALAASDLKAASSQVVCYDGTNLEVSTIGNAPSAPNNTYWMIPGYEGTGATAVANRLILSAYTMPYPVSAGHLVINNSASDGTNNSDFCVYNATGTLIANIGPATYGTSTTKSLAITQGTVTIPAGLIYVGFTSIGATLAVTGVQNTMTPFSLANSTIVTTSGTCPSSITPPATTWTVTGIVMNMAFIP